MRGSIIIFGVILIVGGMFGYMYTQPDIEKMEGWLGTVGRAFEPEMQEQYQMLKLINTGSVIFIVIGGIAILVGLVGGQGAHEHSHSGTGCGMGTGSGTSWLLWAGIGIILAVVIFYTLR